MGVIAVGTVDGIIAIMIGATVASLLGVIIGTKT
jgi:hypothetical protein